jgi:hypothetical protein
MTSYDSPGKIAGGLISTPCFDQSLADYQQSLSLVLDSLSTVSAELAASWGCPAVAGARMATLLPPSGARCAYRLVETPAVPGYVPLRSHGWAALEITVADVWGLHETVKQRFEVIGPPKLVEGFDTFIPMQVIGQAGEVLYLNQVLKSLSDLDLPPAHAPVDHVFIAILAAADREGAVAFYRDTIGFSEGQTWTITYSVINQAFGFDDSVKTAMTMTRVDRTPGIEIDQYPSAATARPQLPGQLPPGAAVVSFLVASLDAIPAVWITPPAVRAEAPYWGRRSATAVGPAGELLELIEAQ